MFLYTSGYLKQMIDVNIFWSHVYNHKKQKCEEY